MWSKKRVELGGKLCAEVYSEMCKSTDEGHSDSPRTNSELENTTIYVSKKRSHTILKIFEWGLPILGIMAFTVKLLARRYGRHRHGEPPFLDLDDRAV